jgi:hypothetical protein
LRRSPGSPGVVWRGARLVLDFGARLEVDVAEPALAAFRDPRLRAVVREIGDRFATLRVGDHRAYRHAQHDVLATLAVLVGASTVLAARRAEDARVAIVDQRVEVAVGDDVDAPPLATIAAAGSAARDELLAPERGRPVAAITRVDLDQRLVEELHVTLRYSTKRSVESPRRLPSHCTA